MFKISFLVDHGMAFVALLIKDFYMWRFRLGVSIRVSVSGSCCVEVGVFD